MKFKDYLREFAPNPDEGAPEGDRYAKLVDDIIAMWDYIGPDCSFCDTAEEKVEQCLDAGRLESAEEMGLEPMHDSAAYTRELIKRMGHEQALKKLADSTKL